MLVQKKVKKLERIKEIREKLRDATRAKLNEAENRKKALVGRVSELGNRKHAAIVTFRNICGSGSTTTEELWWIRENIDCLENEIEEIEHSIGEADKEMEIIVGELVKKHNDVKLTEELLEDSNKELSKQLIKGEQKELDERAIMVFRQ